MFKYLRSSRLVPWFSFYLVLNRTIAKESLDIDCPNNNTHEEDHEKDADEEEVLVLGAQFQEGVEGDLTIH